jgi:hypothetical protein
MTYKEAVETFAGYPGSQNVQALAVLRRAEPLVSAAEEVDKQDLIDDIDFMEKPALFGSVGVLRAALALRTEKKGEPK